MSKPAVPLGRLPTKEAEMFRTVVTCYEQKQYQKGIKTADTILKKFPNHGETLSMKGLINNCLGKKAEAYELVKNGLRCDVRSHICWHVYGLLYRSDNNYKEAIKCYLNALKIDTHNQNIWRDLSWLQIQMRDKEGFVESRKQILDGRPNQKVSWIGYAAAQYSNGSYRAAHDTIKKFIEGGSYKKDVKEAYEDSELLLFQNKCLELDGALEEAIAHLDAHKADVVDRLSWSVKHAELMLLTGKFSEAKDEWHKLVADQTDNYRFHCGFQAAHLELDPAQCRAAFALKRLELPSTEFDLSEEQLSKLRAAYADSKFRSKSLGKIELTLMRRDSVEFRAALDALMRKSLADGMPALHHDLSSLLRIVDPINGGHMIFAKDPVDVTGHPVFVLVNELLDAHLVNLRATGTFNGEGSVPLPEAPNALLWALYLKCHLQELAGRIDEALVLIDECIAHTPTAIDMYSKRARLIKKQGDLLAAAVAMDDCRMLDLQDRYLNNKATKYFLRCDEMTQAMTTVAMFTKHEGDPQKTLFDLQCNWYELEAGESYARAKQWGPALKKFNAVKKHFNDHYDDMFDFHSFCMRKTTLRAYQDVLTMQDTSYTHKFYQRAARGVLRLYTHLLDCPEDVDGLGHMTPADRKKERARVKKQKEKERKAAEDAEKAAQAEESWSGKKDSSDEVAEKPDADPNGEALLTKDFLAEAGVWCSHFTHNLALLDSETLALVADISMRRGKYPQAVRALGAGLRKDPANGDLNAVLVKVVLKLKAPAGKRPSLQATTATVVREELAELLGSSDGLTIGVYVTKLAEACRGLKSLPHLLGAAKCLYMNDKSAASVATISSWFSDAAVWTGRGVTLKNALATLNYLESQFINEAFVATYRAEIQARFPKAALFQESKSSAVAVAEPPATTAVSNEEK